METTTITAVRGMCAIPLESGVAFRVWAPHADSVSIAGTFNDWQADADPMEHEEGGYWFAQLDHATVGNEYKFVIESQGRKYWRIDPYARQVTSSVGNAIVHDPAFDWGDEPFQLAPWNELVIYEMHVGTFGKGPHDQASQAADFDGIEQRFDHLAKLGINVIQLMPTAEFAGDVSWGYNPAHTFVQEVRGLPTSEFHRHGGAIFTGSERYVGVAAGSSEFFDPSGELVENFSGKNEDHFGNFVGAVRSRDCTQLNAEILGEHLSAGLCHLGNISYRLGRQAAPQEILGQLASHKLLDDADDTFKRTRKHLADNGVDIEKTQLTLGSWLRFDPDQEQFIGNGAADALLSRAYRKPFVVPTESEI